MNEQKSTETYDEAIRRTLASSSAMRRDELILALHLDVEEMDKTLNDMIGRNEVETLYPCFSKTTEPCFYRLILDSDDRHQMEQECRAIQCSKLLDFDLFEMELA